MNYRAIAGMLRQHNLGWTTVAERITANAITLSLGAAFEEADPLFDAAEFFERAGVNPEEGVK